MKAQKPPWKKLDESPLQLGDHFLNVFYVERGRKREKFWRVLICKCLISVYPHSQEEYKSFGIAENWDILEWDVWDYLHATYGEQVQDGLYPCPANLAKQADFEKPEKPKRGAASHVMYKSLKARVAELETENARLRQEVEELSNPVELDFHIPPKSEREAIIQVTRMGRGKSNFHLDNDIAEDDDERAELTDDEVRNMSFFRFLDELKDRTYKPDED